MVKFYSYIFIITAVLFSSCNSVEKTVEEIKEPPFKGMKEGVVVYEISYPDEAENSMMLRLMPKELTVKFREHITLFRSSMAFEQVKASFISDLQKKEILTGISYSGKKFRLLLKGEDTKLSTHNFKSYSVTEINDTSNIMGMTCDITEFASPTDTFYVEHTTDIVTDDLYWTGKMKKIHGFPLKFRMVLKGVKADVIAKEIYATKIADSEFELSKKYIPATKEKVNSIFPLYD